MVNLDYLKNLNEAQKKAKKNPELRHLNYSTSISVCTTHCAGPKAYPRTFENSIVPSH